jgi:hypothetical protein
MPARTRPREPTVCRNGFDPELDAFTQSYGGKELDASFLMIALVAAHRRHRSVCAGFRAPHACSRACPSLHLQKQRNKFALAMCVGLGKDRFQLIARRLP